MKPAPELPVLSFESRAAWAKWLAREHARAPGVWLRLAKKGTGVVSITYPEALEVALCYGWIDGQKASDGAEAWKQKFTPRSKKSLWSKVNRVKAQALIDAGEMQSAGLAELERAKSDGRWDAAYDPPSTAAVPDDLRAALDANPKASAFFETLESRNRYAILWRLQTAKRAETRAKHLERFVAMLTRGEKLHP